MTELKTLKDINNKAIGEPDFVYTTKLKAEAVKWYKEGNIIEFDAGIFIKHFFNLTEDDLK